MENYKILGHAQNIVYQALLFLLHLITFVVRA